ncbi:DUF397 domain-containing protein [Streptomyces sp. NPDC008001]|uniref:DUF397 domain-containing protein n=1 Tax=Streptomyces sp. NPDC008001 TaxID=3364804 RepID=UPI0036DFCB7F
MTTEQNVNARAWRKSSYSGGGGGTGTDDCVEVADNIPGTVPVRDSKLLGASPVVAFRPVAWRTFVEALKRG